LVVFAVVAAVFIVGGAEIAHVGAGVGFAGITQPVFNARFQGCGLLRAIFGNKKQGAGVVHENTNGFGGFVGCVHGLLLISLRYNRGKRDGVTEVSGEMNKLIMNKLIMKE
jgi:hypothetical protein